MCVPGSPSPPSPPPRYEDEISKRTDMEFTFVQLKKVASPAHPMGSFLRDPLPSFAHDPQTKAPQAESQDHRQKAKHLSPPSSKALCQVSSGNLPHHFQEAKSPLTIPLPWDPSIPLPIIHHCSHPQDLDAECLRRTELETKLKGLQSVVELMKSIYEQVRRRGQGPAEPTASWSPGRGCRGGKGVQWVVETSAGAHCCWPQMQQFPKPLVCCSQ